MDNPDVNHPGIKAIGALAGAGFVNVIDLTHWFQLGAAFFAFVYAAAVFFEWMRKKMKKRKAAADGDA